MTARGAARRLGAVLALAAAPALAAPAAATQVVAVFPTDRLTVADPVLPTGRRVNLPLPSCTADAAGCAETRLLNQLDGFSVNPRVSVRFSRGITLDSVSRDSAFIVPVVTEPGGSPIGLDQLVWDPATHTLYARPERLLLQSRRYAVVITARVVDDDDRPLRPAPGWLQLRATGPDAARVEAQLWRNLEAAGVARRHVVAAALFTTQTVTRDLERMRALLETRPAPVLRFALEPGGGRSVYLREALESVQARRHIGTGAAGRMAYESTLPLAVLPAEAVRAVAFGSYRAASFLDADRVIPPARGEAPRIRGEEDVHVTVMLPAGPTPPTGWPVVIAGHGYTGERTGMALAVGATLARHGFATVAINIVGHGGGPESELLVNSAGRAPVVLPAGGRGVDLDGDRRIGRAEGLGPTLQTPVAMVGSRDGLRQTVADLMQLVRALEAGVDVDGDGRPDLDGARLSYVGVSMGGMYGTMLMATEPRVRVGVINVSGGPVVEIARQSPVYRGFLIEVLRTRRPPLMNGEGDFYEFLPLPGQPPVRATFPGALEIQALLDRVEWIGQAGNPVAYAPYLRQAPLPGSAPKAVLVQMAVGDREVPNPTTENLVRAGDLHLSTSIYRHDRVAPTLPDRFRDPHGYLAGWLFSPEVAAIAQAAQDQVARFFLSAGRDIAPTHPHFELRPLSPR